MLARLSIIYALVVSVAYFIFCIRRRAEIKAPTPLPSLLIMIGSAAWIVVLAIAAALAPATLVGLQSLIKTAADHTADILHHFCFVLAASSMRSADRWSSVLLSH